MALDDQDLSPSERMLVNELAGLSGEPGPERRDRIMAAVRNAPSPPRAWINPWRAAAAVAAAVVVLTASSAGAVAASGDAVPSSPNYPLRSLGEEVRLTFADPAKREQLRISFAQSRISQAQAALHRGDRSDARQLLRDSQAYLLATSQDIRTLSSGEQGAVQNKLDEAQAQQSQAEGQLNQQGEQGQNGG